MAGLSCGSKCAKYTLFVFNLLFWLAGAALLGVSIWLLVDEDASRYLQLLDIEGSSDALVRASAIMLCVIGGIIFVTGFLGCCGAMRESSCMLVMYAAIVIVLLCAQITAGVLAVVYRDQIMSRMQNSMNMTVQMRYGKPGYEAETDAWELMQQEFKCCAVLDGSEWVTSYWYGQQNKTGGIYNVPPSCCVLSSVEQPKDYRQCSDAALNPAPGDEEFYFREGCLSSLEDWVKTHAAILIGIAFGLAATQILAIIIACCLRSAINEGRHSAYHT